MASSAVWPDAPADGGPVDAVPYWTARMYRAGGGQDHLGLGSVVTDRILPRMSPGINVLTIHPRYWSFYAFVLSEFWRRDLPRSRAALRDWYRPLECVYSIACSLCDSDDHRGSPVGSRRIGAVVGDDRASFDPRFHYMDSSLGGYGLYYATAMQGLGLVAQADRRLGLPVDAVTPDGQVVADAFRSVVAGTRYYRDWLDRHDEAVPRDVVEEYGAVACFCRLREATATDRPILVDAFLHRGNPDDADARRETLRLFCELAAQTAESPVGADSFRRLAYYGADYREDGDTAAAFDPPEWARRPARRWRLYQAREYYNASLNEMWRRLSCWGLERDGETYPVPMADVMASIAEVDFDGFGDAVGVALPDGGLSAESPASDLLAWARTACSASGQLDDRWDLEAPLTEDLIVGWLGYGDGSTETGADVLAAALALLALVAVRLWLPELALVEPADWFAVQEGQRERLGMQRFLDGLRRRVEEGETVGEVARWLTVDYVIAQHERVATAKLPSTGDTFRFRREAGRLRFFDKNAQVGMNNSRYNSLATVLYELGWSGYLYEPGHDLTDEGEQLRALGDLAPTGAFDAPEPTVP